MKYKTWLICAILIAAVVFGACDNDSNNTASKETFDKDASYAMGVSIGADFLENMEASEIYLNIDEFIKGLSDVMKGKQTRFDRSEANNIIDKAFMAMMDERTAQNEQEEVAFLVENAKRPGINITSSGLQFEVINEGNGPKPSFTDEVLIHYEGRLSNGMIFDSTYERMEPLDFRLNEVIPGWAEGVQLMNVGSHYVFYIPSVLGYGKEGVVNPWTGEVIIPPFATLIFIVELLDIIK
ncbi:MAG: FKBP-type peptidyl-prolyl cis-trans isomerase [Treponema sp.]|nr:FKBP-type peptidyl-prolyl cis-trans isomerase [Treponema sp.]